jgi:hypothetical protein
VAVNNITPQWPAWGHDRRWAWSLESLEPLTIVRKDYLLSGELHSTHILDSALQLFKVFDVRDLGRAGLFGWRPGFRGVYLRVEPVLKLETNMTLVLAKNYVVDFLSRHPEIYAATLPLSELSPLIMNSKSAKELLLVLSR